MLKYKIGDLVEWNCWYDEWALAIITEEETPYTKLGYRIKFVQVDSSIYVGQHSLRLPTYYPTPMGYPKLP